MLHYISRSVRVVVNCIVRVSQSKIPLNIYGGGERWCNVTTVPCSTFCILPYVLWTSSQRIRFPLGQRYPLEIDLYASCYHAIGTRNVNMFSQVSNIQTISNLSRAYTRSAQNICDSSPAQSIKRWNQQKSFQRLKMRKKSRRHPENGEGHIGQQEGRDRPLPRIHILRKNREATCSEIRTSGTLISGSVS
jgi:hypothetical protein